MSISFQFSWMNTQVWDDWIVCLAFKTLSTFSKWLNILCCFVFSTPSLMCETSSYCTPSLVPGKVYLPSATAVAMHCVCWTQRNTPVMPALGKYGRKTNNSILVLAMKQIWHQHGLQKEKKRKNQQNRKNLIGYSTSYNFSTKRGQRFTSTANKNNFGHNY